MTTYLSGWRLALGLVLAALFALLVLSTILWLAALLAVVVAVAWLNLVFLPRMARRLRLPRLVLDVVCLALLGAVGWLLGGTTGLAAGAIGWGLGVGAPRLLGWRMRRRLRDRTQRRRDVLELEPGASARESDVWHYERRP